MNAAAYRLKNPATVVIRQANRYRLMQLPTGSVFRPLGSKSDFNGMIEGTCKRNVVLIFSRDLEDCAEPAAKDIYTEHSTSYPVWMVCELAIT
jgi:hypothetical protein